MSKRLEQAKGRTSEIGKGLRRLFHPRAALSYEGWEALLRLRARESARCSPVGGELVLEETAEGGKLFFRILAVYIMPYYSLIPRGR